MIQTGDHTNSPRSGDMMLTSWEGVPFPFTVIIQGALPPVDFKPSFIIKGKDPDTGITKMCLHHLEGRDHKAYLDFFSEVASDFGLRLPRNRQPAEKPTFAVTYREVLLDNIAPGMIYGYGDPAVIKVEGNESGETWYYLVVTSNDAPDAFPIIRSKNLADWEFVGYIFPRDRKPEWASEGLGVSDYWAPEMHRIENEYRIYFVSRDKDNHELCIGAARSAQPSGPFIPDAFPILRGNTIDPHVFVADNEDAYLFWKEDNNDVWPARLLELLYGNPGFIAELFPHTKDQVTASFMVTFWPWARMLEPMERFQAIQIFIEAVTDVYAGFFERLRALMNAQPQRTQTEILSVLHYMKTPIFAQRLSRDGSGLVGEVTRIIENDLSWEAHLVEGMWVTKQENRYYLFYAGNDFSTNLYGIGVAIADDPLGPYRKMQTPILQSSARWLAPGHPSLVKGPDGKPRLFLHAFFPGKAGYKQFRALLSIEVEFKPDEVRIVPEFPQ